jgi:hypothetical protein
MTKEMDMKVTYESATELSAALMRAAAAHGLHEEETGEADPDWPIWYSEYMVVEQAGRPAGAGTPP